ncbi:MAG TPA: hypothetical protein VFT70_18985 [Nocardioides sp.]|nr:hypothetical protein [Nocardioides sp.]
MTTTEIRAALTEVRAAVEVPPVDDVAFRARVRTERRRQRGGRVLTASAAAVVLAAGAVGVAQLVGAETGRDVPVASGRTAEAGAVAETVWFVRDGRLTALDPSGQVHDLGLPSEGVVGYTAERVYAVDAESHVVVRGRQQDPDRPGRDTAYPPAESPVPGAVQSVALSGDGRYLAWMDLGHTVTVYDLEAEGVDFRVDVPRNSYVAAVSADGVLVSEDVDLVLHTATGEELAVPTQEAGDNWGAQAGGGRVLVAGPTGESSVYDLQTGVARRIAVVGGGSGALAQDGTTVATIETAPDDSAVVNLWDGRSTQPLRGLDGVPQQVRFAGEDTLLVQTRGGSATLWACATDSRTCGALPVPDGSFRLAE